VDAGLCFRFVNWAGRLGTIFAINTMPVGFVAFASLRPVQPFLRVPLSKRKLPA
jgi:hypothetical protein